MVQRLLMLGPDRYALADVAKRPDVDTVMIYGSHRKDFGLAPTAHHRVHQVFAEDPANVECVLAALERAGRPLDLFDAVYTNDEASVVTAATLAQAAGIRGLPISGALGFRDKSLQKARLAVAGIQVADFHVIEDIREPDLDPLSRFDRMVVKPIAGAGTRRTALISNREEFDAYVKDCRTSTQRTFIAERFVPGEEWQCDGVVFGGEVQFFALGRYGQPCLTALGQRKPVQIFKFGRAGQRWAYELAEPIVKDALMALGMAFGVFHMELFHDAASGSLTFSECAARRGGALTQEQVRHHFNVDLATAAVDCALGVRPDLTGRREREGVSASTYLPVKGGVLVSCPDAREIAARPKVVYARIEVPIGFSLPAVAADTGGDKIGQVLVHGDDQAEVELVLDGLVGWFAARTDSLAPAATGRVLRQRATAAGFSFESDVDESIANEQEPVT